MITEFYAVEERNNTYPSSQKSRVTSSTYAKPQKHILLSVFICRLQYSTVIDDAGQ
jgi:hypothetical protein